MGLGGSLPGMSPRTGVTGTPEIVDEDVMADEFNCKACDSHMGSGDKTCRECGAVNPRYVREGVEPVTDFDRFMDRIVGDERQRTVVDPAREDNPQRRRAARNQDRPMNRTRWGGNRG